MNPDSNDVANLMGMAYACAISEDPNKAILNFQNVLMSDSNNKEAETMLQILSDPGLLFAFRFLITHKNKCSEPLDGYEFYEKFMNKQL